MKLLLSGIIVIYLWLMLEAFSQCVGVVMSG
jgi:hypothetical protein